MKKHAIEDEELKRDEELRQMKSTKVLINLNAYKKDVESTNAFSSN
jgi:hypothetical protein